MLSEGAAGLPNAWRSKGDEIGFVSTADAAALLGLTPSRQFLLLARLFGLESPNLGQWTPKDVRAVAAQLAMHGTRVEQEAAKRVLENPS
jgi:hypothetical protein